MSFVHRKSWKIMVVVATVLVALVTVFFFPRIPQDPSYHHFVDQRRIFGIPHFWNVITNIPFLFAGVLGLCVCLPKLPRGGLGALKPVYLLFFIGITFVSLGSAYYHLDPSNQTLLWDRLPMTIAFMAFFCLVVGENVSVTIGKGLMGPLLLIGIGAVAFWYVSELSGQGDLRAYALVQFLPMVLIPLILVIYESRLSGNVHMWIILGLYTAAKLIEHLDAAVFYTTNSVISGHSMKHLLAAFGGAWMVVALVRRRETVSNVNQT